MLLSDLRSKTLETYTQCGNSKEKYIFLHFFPPRFLDYKDAQDYNENIEVKNEKA